jgi:hypothetical protein
MALPLPHPQLAKACHEYHCYSALELKEIAIDRGVAFTKNRGNPPLPLGPLLCRPSFIIEKLQEDDDETPCRLYSIPNRPYKTLLELHRMRKVGHIEYNLWSRRELVWSVRNRHLLPGIDTVATSTLVLAKALISADESATFPFFDLPPELRVLVYEHILSIPTISYKCHPQILRASKKVHSEASDTIYAVNTLKVNIYSDRKRER